MEIAREARRKVMLRATMCTGGPRVDVCVRDISSRGMMVQAGAPPPRGTFVELDCAGHEIVGMVIWRREHRFGLQTRDRINVRSLAHGIPPATDTPRPAGARAVRRPAARTGARADAEASRILAGKMELAVVLVFGAALVAGLAASAFETLSRPFGAVSSLLGH
jgi:hypothetical protein